jgi:hypothetical protein
LKIEGHVTEASDAGDKLRIVGQGRAVASAEWQPWLSITIDVPMNERNKKAFHIGRQLDLRVRPT